MGGEEAARVLKTVGTPCDPGFKMNDHLAVGIALDLIDFETGATVSGAKCALKHALRTCAECCLITGLLIHMPRANAAQFAEDMWMECRFVYLRRAAALLELALCNYAMQKVASKGFMPMTTPDLVRESVLVKCGFQPRGENTQVLRCTLRTLAAPRPGYTVLERHW